MEGGRAEGRGPAAGRAEGGRRVRMPPLRLLLPSDATDPHTGWLGPHLLCCRRGLVCTLSLTLSLGSHLLTAGDSGSLRRSRGPNAAGSERTRLQQSRGMRILLGPGERNNRTDNITVEQSYMPYELGRKQIMEVKEGGGTLHPPHSTYMRSRRRMVMA